MKQSATPEETMSLEDVAAAASEGSIPERALYEPGEVDAVENDWKEAMAASATM
jgi:hypothetical protein